MKSKGLVSSIIFAVAAIIFVVAAYVALDFGAALFVAALLLGLYAFTRRWSEGSSAVSDRRGRTGRR